MKDELGNFFLLALIVAFAFAITVFGCSINVHVQSEIDKDIDRELKIERRDTL